jgi:glycosyltransferase involved in cell wall biosynthesis
MNILLIEPYFTGSHATWARDYQTHSAHQIEILKLSGAYWKWRMHGGAVTLARQFLESDSKPDLILATDMLDVTTFLALTRSRTASTPVAMYFHENQLSYPWSPTDRDVLNKRDRHYGFINYVSAMASDAIFFNSAYHRESFHVEVDRLLKHFPDHNESHSGEVLRERSQVLHLGLSLKKFDEHVGSDSAISDGPPIVLWNHRWEYDKNPDEFFDTLIALAADGVDFRLVILGERFSKQPDIFDRATLELGERVIHAGYAETAEEYAGWLHMSDILPVTSNQDFFGASIVEATYCRCRPLLPSRLTYPEIIPRAFHGQVLYDNGEFSGRLRALLTSGASLVPGLKEAVSVYDWTVMAPEYDEAFARIARKKE